METYAPLTVVEIRSSKLSRLKNEGCGQQLKRPPIFRGGCFVFTAKVRQGININSDRISLSFSEPKFHGAPANFSLQGFCPTLNLTI